MSGMEKNVKMHTITIDGKMFQAREDQTVLQVARENGINIPIMINKNSCILTSFIDS